MATERADNPQGYDLGELWETIPRERRSLARSGRGAGLVCYPACTDDDIAKRGRPRKTTRFAKHSYQIGAELVARIDRATERLNAHGGRGLDKSELVRYLLSYALDQLDSGNLQPPTGVLTEDVPPEGDRSTISS